MEKFKTTDPASGVPPILSISWKAEAKRETQFLVEENKCVPTGPRVSSSANATFKGGAPRELHSNYSDSDSSRLQASSGKALDEQTNRNLPFCTGRQFIL